MTKSNFTFIIFFFIFKFSLSAAHATGNNELHPPIKLLPPIKQWHGKSEQLIQSSQNIWQTPAEATGLIDTPNYDETMQYLKKLVDSEAMFQLRSLGKSPQGRDLWLVVASKEGISSSDKLKANNKPTLLVQAGIHSGEIDGKDAGLMLLRDISKGNKAALLNRVNLLFIPIFNVDGHERRSPFNRVNQRGPEQMGWRTTSQNLNLNRDYSKADTPEMQILLQSINQWKPDLYFDVHVTDGEDYQYDITYGYNEDHADSPQISRWLSDNLKPDVNKALAEQGHRGGPLTFGIDRSDFAKGLSGWTATPRFSNGYGDVRHLPTVLVENHSLKPYKQRVLGTYIMLEATLKLLAEKGNSLKQAIQRDRQSRPETQVLKWKKDKKHPEKMDFYGIDFEKKKDIVTGLEYIYWNGQPKLYKNLPIFWSRIADLEVNVPKAYWIPAEHLQVIERLELHGIQFTRSVEKTKLRVAQLTASSFEFGKEPFEGHMRASAKFNTENIEMILPAGTVRVSTNQALGRLAVALLDPRGDDSFFSWGFFNQMFQRTEYIESYALIPLANQMIQKDVNLAKSFHEKKLKDKDFASDQQAQMRWFYQQSDFYDQSYLKYPVLFEE